MVHRNGHAANGWYWAAGINVNASFDVEVYGNHHRASLCHLGARGGLDGDGSVAASRSVYRVSRTFNADSPLAAWFTDLR
jgi:hypothetical protein